jgi:dCTP deaminase
MILSGRDIQWYIEKGRLEIDPVEKEQFQQNGIDLVLENLAMRGTEASDFLGLHPPILRLEFYLGCTRETLALPDDLMAFVQLRSGWARRGLLIAPTIVDAGFRGNLTVEIFSAGYEGPSPIGQRFLHLIFAKLASPGDAYAGVYQGQSGITPSKL